VNNEVSTTALVIIAASGGVGALIAGLVAAWVNWLTEKSRAKREAATWLREKKMASFSSFLANARVMVSAAGVGAEGHEGVRANIMQFNQSEFEVRLLLRPDHRDEFNRMRSLIAGARKDDKDATRAAQAGVDELTIFLRRELGLPD
jgi:hypothetical protein